MKERIISGVLGAIFFLLILWLGSWWYSVLISILASICFLEYCRLFGFSYRKPQVILGLLFVWLIIVSGLKTQFGLDSVALFEYTNIIILGLVIFLALLVFSRNQFDIYQMAHLFIGTIYIGLGFSYMIQMIWHPDGLIWSLFVLLIIWANDTGAYFTGKNLGKRKLWPSISPNKTVEGSIGGILLGVIVSGFFSYFCPQIWTMGYAIILGLLISVVGQLGDLVESAIKRSTGAKDSGRILPGHGGVLDRFDSLIFTFLILQIFTSTF
ncbi:phosphatidate cytidylyltransferase [Shimazuella kribbensis]|uniref:phosphatidate cytidylyltransferase n=1 Tax=Shimazuella kribbensis TaxID=139808 RepID=UPI0004118A12|nr:phosphatidate cytidylyltransferase [Shimazuella kribbensis]